MKERQFSDRSLSAEEIQQLAKGRVEGYLSPEELIQTIKAQLVRMDREVWANLDREFIFRHELSFTLFAPSDGVIRLCRNHTKYDAYAQDVIYLAAIRDERLYQHDKEELLREGYVVGGNYHTHPITKARQRFRDKNLRLWARRGERPLFKKESCPSDGDIEAWISDEIKEAFMFIGHKWQEADHLVVRAFVPIAIFSKLGGQSAVKPKTSPGIDEQEYREYLRALFPVVSEIVCWDKREKIISSWCFIEIPIKVRSRPF